ncbi:MAG TPA: restriction endonuclease [Clostridia bacterium]|nr:restriction endonuclease [Clostridia bacterium]
MVIPGHWWIISAVVALALYLIGDYLCRLEAAAPVGLYEIDRMDKKSFQRFCGRLLKQVGYRVSRPKEARQWVSFVLEKDGLKMALVAKQYGGPVGVRPVEKASAGAARNRCARAIVLTNREFTPEARQRAAELGVELWDRDKLADLIIVSRSRHL